MKNVDRCRSFPSHRHLVPLPLAVLVLATPVAAQVGWEEVDRLDVAPYQVGVDTDGEHLLLSGCAGNPPYEAEILRREAGTWVPQQTLTKAGPIRWTTGVVDGGRIALAWGSSAGFVDVFELDAAGWSLFQTIQAPTAGGGFGRGQDLSGDTLVVGDPQGSTRSSALVYRRRAEGWTPVQALPGPFASGGDGFGVAVALDGTRLVVGAPGVGSGVAYVYELGPEGFVETAQLSGGVRNLGQAVAVRGDTILVGDGGCASCGPSAPSGLALFFELEGGGSWVETRRLLDPDDDPESGFGATLALGPGVAAVSSPYPNGATLATPRLHLLHRIGGSWLLSGNPEEPPPKRFGLFGSGLAFDGQELLATSNAGNGAGELHVFDPRFHVRRSRPR